LESWEKRTKKWTYVLEGKEKVDWDAFLFSDTELRLLPAEVKQTMMGFKKVYLNASFNNFGSLTLATLEPMTDRNFDILLRFARVFELTYTRYNDLKQAESQAREAQIETALERVRGRAMAMHSPQELRDVVYELRQQMGMLGQKDLDTCVIHLHDESPDLIHAWVAIRPPESNEDILKLSAHLPKKGLLIIEEAMEAYAANKKDYVIINEGEKIRQWFGFIQKTSPESFAKIEEVIKDTSMESSIRSYWSFADFAGGSLLMVTTDEPDETSRALLRRFADVFGLAYRRFADLKQAEAQAREAQIEAALERVRARTMAMRESSELIDTAELLFDQLKQLGAESQGVAFAICDKDSTMVKKWTSIGVFSVPYTFEPGEQRMYEAWQAQEDIYEEVYEGEKLSSYYELFMEIPEFREGIQKFIDSGHPIPIWQKNHAVPFKYGYLLLITSKPFEETQIFIRFAKVFEQTYTRFLDLQKAEAQAIEATKQASLDRVRGEIASMRSAEDLKIITPLVWSELTTLGIPFIRCGVFIVHETEEEARSLSLQTKWHIPGGDVPSLWLQRSRRSNR
jgi:hypothetical protein